jgi:hypothetical protein
VCILPNEVDPERRYQIEAAPVRGRLMLGSFCQNDSVGGRARTLFYIASNAEAEARLSLSLMPVHKL